MDKMVPKQGFFNSLKNLFFNCFWIWTMMNSEHLHCFLYSCTNPTFGKNIFPEIWTSYALGQSDSSVFKLTVFMEQNHEISLGHGTPIYSFKKWINWTDLQITNIQN